MKPTPMTPAAIAQPSPQDLALSGHWTARGIGAHEGDLAPERLAAAATTTADGAGITAMDTAGAWVLHTLLSRLRREGHVVTLRGLRPEFARRAGVRAAARGRRGRAPTGHAARPWHA